MRRFSHRETVRHHYYRVREAVIAYLGGRCSRCGFTDPRALQVDHIVPKNQGGGFKRHPTAEYKAVLDGEPGYQLLCANCNWIKRAENHEARPRKV